MAEVAVSEEVALEVNMVTGEETAAAVVIDVEVTAGVLASVKMLLLVVDVVCVV